MERKKLLVEGTVQGVGFRFFCKLIATEIRNLTGYVKNLNNGNVLIEIQGDANLLSLFINKLYEGTKFCKVKNIHMKNEPIKIDEKKFNIIY